VPRAFRVPIGWGALLKRTATEVITDNCFGLAAELAYYCFLALFPALLFLVALLSFVPIEHLMDTITGALARVAPDEVLTLIQNQIVDIAQHQSVGLVTLGMIGTIWSTSAGITAIISTLNDAYDIQEGRPWWKVRVTAVVLTIALAVFIVVATVLVVAGPMLATTVAAWFHLSAAFTTVWAVAQWPLVLVLVSLGMAIIYYYAPDAEQDWIWITPGSILATVLWLGVSLGFRAYVTRLGSFNETYGTIGGVIVVLLWFYLSGLAVLTGAELNAEIEHASPYGKDPGEKVPGERKKIGPLAERFWKKSREAGTFEPAIALSGTCDIDRELPRTLPAPRRPRASDWILSGLALGQAAILTYARLRSRFKRFRI
jgi:membrane protein